MKLKKIDTEGLLECVRCGRHFYYEDSEQVITYLYGKEIPVRCCPYCKSKEYESVNEQKRLDQYRFLPITTKVKLRRFINYER